LSNVQKNNKADNFNESFSIEFNHLHSSEEVEGITLSKILMENNFKNMDILKLDIEGAERYVFDESSIDWIDKVKVIIFNVQIMMKVQVVLHSKYIHSLT
jgi:FkbM family methyltransferase